MKKLILAAALALSFNAQANDALCAQIGGLATTAMEGRQDGVALSAMLEPFDIKDDSAVTQMVRALIIEAYKRPRWHTDESHKRAVEDYRDEVTLECLQ